MNEVIKKDEIVKEITLPSGKNFCLKKGKGKHLFAAQRVAGSDFTKVQPALAAALGTIDGKPFVAEDLDEMNLDDVLEILGSFDNKKGEKSPLVLPSAT